MRWGDIFRSMFLLFESPISRPQLALGRIQRLTRFFFYIVQPVIFFYNLTYLLVPEASVHKYLRSHSTWILDRFRQSLVECVEIFRYDEVQNERN